LLTLAEKTSSWSDNFDVALRQLCGMSDTAVPDTGKLQAPTVWGRPIRLQMLLRNIITNAIQHGKPREGEQHINISYDLIDHCARMHPCLVRSDQDNDVARSLSWYLSSDCGSQAKRFVQVIVTDNGPGIEEKKQHMIMVRDEESLAAGSGASSGDPGASFRNAELAGCRTNFGICLQRIVCPEVANNHGAIGVHSRVEPAPGCSFVVALPYCSGTMRCSGEEDAVFTV
jgi:hypothetical protein